MLLLAIALIFVCLCSLSTSPLDKLSSDNDSSLFQLIGSLWAKGYLPYVDYWELKGPFIFLINALGYGMTGTRYGVCILQIAFMTFTLWAVYKTSHLQMGKWPSLCISFLFLLSLFSLYDQGNLVEEYCLPFLAISFYLQYKWLNLYIENRQIVHQPIYAAFYGATFAVCLLTRLTNALGLCGGVAFITIFLLLHRQYKNLGNNILAFVFGSSLIVIPFVVYFYLHDALRDMWNGTFLFPLKYSGQTGVGSLGDFFHRTFFRSFIDLYVCFAVGLLVVIKRKRLVVGLWMLSISVFLCAWLVSSYGFGHYGMLAVPYISIIAAESYLMIKDKRNVAIRTLVMFVLIIYSAMAISKNYNYYQHYWGPGHEENRNMRGDVLMAKIPTEDYSAVAIYETVPSYYLNYGIVPCYKYPSCLDFIFGIDPEFDKIVLSQFDSCKAKWILVDRNKGKPLHIDNILQSRYQVADTYEGFFLYQRKD